MRTTSSDNHTTDYEAPTLEPYGHVAELTSVVDGTYDGPGNNPGQ